MANFRKACEIKCPYYVNAKDDKENCCYITCEGAGGAKYISSRYRNKKERDDHIDRECSRYPNDCVISKVNDDKY